VLVAGVSLEILYNAAFPLAMRSLIDSALIGGNRRVLLGVLLVLSIGGLMASAIRIASDYVYAQLAGALLRDLREALLEHLSSLSMRFFGRAASGDILQRFSSDLGVIESALTTAVPWGVIPAMDVLSCTALLFVLEWRLALAAMLVYP